MGKWCGSLSSSLLGQQKGDDPAMIQHDTPRYTPPRPKKMGTSHKTIFIFLIIKVVDYTFLISLFTGYPWQPAHGKYLVGVRFSTIMWWCVAYIEK